MCAEEFHLIGCSGCTLCTWISPSSVPVRAWVCGRGVHVFKQILPLNPSPAMTSGAMPEGLVYVLRVVTGLLSRHTASGRTCGRQDYHTFAMASECVLSACGAAPECEEASLPHFARASEHVHQSAPAPPLQIHSSSWIGAKPDV